MTKGKIILVILGVATLGAAGFLLYRKFGKKSQGATGGSDDSTSTGGSTTSGGTITQVKSASPTIEKFPLAFGSRGQLVKDIQNALMIMFPGSLPKFGKDGIWGAETEAALKKHNLPTTIKKPDYDRIIAASKAGPVSPNVNTGVSGWF